MRLKDDDPSEEHLKSPVAKYHKSDALTNEDRTRLREISHCLTGFVYAGDYYQSDRKGTYRPVKSFADRIKEKGKTAILALRQLARAA